MIIVWVILVLCVAVVLAVGIERLIARLGILNEDSGPKGLAIIAERLERWSTERRRRD